MSQRPTKHVHKVGDEVTIVEPQVFNRVGYPMGLAEAREIVSKAVGEALVTVFANAGAPVDRQLIDHRLTVSDRDYDKALDCIAHSYLAHRRFGGPIRSIHTTLREELRGKRARVAAKRVVKTGTYHTGYWDEEGGDPSYLGSVKTHVILELDLVSTLFESPFEIEECWVRSTANSNACGDCDPCLGGRPDQCAVDPLIITTKANAA